MIIHFFTRNIIFHEPFYEHQQGSTRDALGRTMRSLSPQCSLPADYLGKLCAICAKSNFICQAARRRFQYTNLHIITTREANITRLLGLSESFRMRVFVFVKVWFEKYFSGWETAAKIPRIFVGNMIWKGSDVVRVGFEAKCEWYFSEVVCLPSLNIAAAIR